MSGHHIRLASVIGCALLVSAPTTLRDVRQGNCPAGVTEASVKQGRLVYFGAPSCVTCHGAKGKGGANGPDLTDDQWLHGSGSYEDIVKLVTHGVPQAESKTGHEMPQRGWANQADDWDIKAVAAYVWSLSHTCKMKPGARG